ncbi:EAL domain-containing protein [Spirochaeta isovalerica]|uniref:EAL domain-containing protein (Putative c-di-GMP-specific phosphodiesterase class I) n=1 Tax=Spirochaeta isovalerica TaxID=150 RepID=A0A841RAW7_9SPIO|nr:EAL domain-containing protein [Spirochaeta isovalerica]MBB6480501.1 EAL domain-containing protein (putative c-di-GMP-specific phosphodiesterase class I) [Spirochaeta isovalerica]
MNELTNTDIFLPLIYTCFTIPSLYILFRYYLLNRKKEFLSLLLLVLVFNFFLIAEGGARIAIHFYGNLLVATQLSRLQEASLIFLYILVPYVIGTNFSLMDRWKRINRFFLLIGVVTAVYMLFFIFFKPDIFIDVKKIFSDSFIPGNRPGRGATGYLFKLRDIFLIVYFSYGVAAVLVNKKDHHLNQIQSSILIGVVIIFAMSIGDLIADISGARVSHFSNIFRFELGVTIFSLFVFSRSIIYLLRKGLLLEVTQQKLEEHQKLLEFQAIHRKESGLLNRRAFHEAVRGYFSGEETGKGLNGLLYIRIGNYRQLYESFGSDRTRDIMRQVCFRLENVQTDLTVLYHTEPEEFVVFVRNADSEEYIRRYAGVLRSILLQRVLIGEDSYYVRSLIGVLLLPRDGASLDEVQRNSYNTLNNASRSPDRILYFDERIRKESLNQYSLITHIQTAVRHNEFTFRYLPLLNQMGGREGFVLRLHWDQPYTFQELTVYAEKSGLIHELHKMSTQMLYNDVRILRSRGVEGRIYGMLNTSLLLAEGFADRVINTLETANFTVNDVGFVIFDNSHFQMKSFIVQNITILKDYGFDLILDESRSSNNSLDTLLTVPIDKIILKREILTGLESDERKKIYIHNILRMMNDLDYTTIADGVESKEIQSYLKNEGISLFLETPSNKPVSIEELIQG